MIGSVALAILSALARLLGPILPFLATWVAAKRDAAQAAKNRGLEATVEAMKKREAINDDVANDPDLVARAKRAGVVRPERK